MTASPIRQLALQAAATILVLSLAWPYHLVTRLPLDWNLAALLIGIAAFCLASWGRLPWWWRLIHLIFAPAAALVAGWQIDPFWFLLGFMLLLLLYRGALAGQVPLFLSSAMRTRTPHPSFRPTTSTISPSWWSGRTPRCAPGIS